MDGVNACSVKDLLAAGCAGRNDYGGRGAYGRSVAAGGCGGRGE